MRDTPTVLIADDREDNVELVRNLLTMEGYQVVSAADGQEALEMAYEHLPDLVILDLNMPRLNGYEVCERLKRDSKTAGIPVLMLTAWSDIDQRVKGLQVGAEDYLAKPFDYRELLMRVEARLRTKQETDRLKATQQMIRETFERYVSPRVVERMLADPNRVRLGGTLQTITVLFADLRGFTLLAESLPPAQLVDVLNGYLTVAMQAILAYEGLAQPDHALRAARAAFRLGQGMASYHAGLEPHLRLEFGVGLVTGEAIVGNIGARQWLNYTAIGDTVNLAQRLEEMAAGGEILIDECTYQALGTAACVEAKGLTPIRGRNEPRAIFTLLDLAEGERS
jgi:adenylate cyclase